MTSSSNNTQFDLWGDLSLKAVDLTNCDREPIHIPGSIQPHGLLLVMEAEDLVVRQVSQNAQALTGIAATDWLDRPLSQFFTDQSLRVIRTCLERNFEVVNPVKVYLNPGDDDAPTEGVKAFSAVVHQTAKAEIVVELEPQTDASSDRQSGQQMEEAPDFFRF